MTDDLSRAPRPLSLDATSWPDLPPAQAERFGDVLIDALDDAYDVQQRQYRGPLVYDVVVAPDPSIDGEREKYPAGVHHAVGSPVDVPPGWKRTVEWTGYGPTAEMALTNLDECLAGFYGRPAAPRTITHGPPWPDDRAHSTADES